MEVALPDSPSLAVDLGVKVLPLHDLRVLKCCCLIHFTIDHKVYIIRIITFLSFYWYNFYRYCHKFDWDNDSEKIWYGAQRTVISLKARRANIHAACLGHSFIKLSLVWLFYVMEFLFYMDQLEHRMTFTPV